jgi:diketogulonate reductase-like aldo/keto reductase
MDTRRRALLAALAGLAAEKLIAQEAAKMTTRTIPSTGEAMPLIGLGTWQTFDVGGDAAARAPLGEVLKAFAAGGGKLVDSSPMYGSSESVAGDLMERLGLRDRLFVATKVWTSGRTEGLRQMEDSIRKLRVKQLDLMQVHNLLDVATHTKTLEDWKQKGRIRYLGITHYSVSAHGEVERVLKARPYDFLQINYSLAERDAEQRLLPLCQEKKVAVIINRPFAEGALFRRTKGKPLPPWAAELGIKSWAQYFLKWIAGHPAVTCVIPATSKPDHLKDNQVAGYGALPDATAREKMRAHFDAL